MIAVPPLRESHAPAVCLRDRRRSLVPQEVLDARHEHDVLRVDAARHLHAEAVTRLAHDEQLDAVKALVQAENLLQLLEHAT